MSDQIVTLGGLTATLRAPSPTHTHCILAAMPRTDVPEDGGYDQDHGARLVMLAVALAACWPDGVRWPGRFRPVRIPLTRLREFGEEVLDDLIGAGLDIQSVIDAGAAAIPLLTRAATREAEGIEEAVGNSEVPPAT